VYVYGIATEYCVRLAVLGLRERGYAVSVVVDAVKAIEEAAGVKALEEMREAGAEVATTAEVARRLGGG
jgi:nicotinamidase/pyrazinamidase